ncbi:hypothetical protein [Peribacillus simplex]|uniref:hypothetical protein n=1 Tax=Peribacillus simplex TaxID=1478 RepID=UPI000A892071|nr:hypothetical protein [Peribacillus simplex]
MNKVRRIDSNLPAHPIMIGCAGRFFIVEALVYPIQDFSATFPPAGYSLIPLLEETLIFN